jgi:hypothetical protein
MVEQEKKLAVAGKKKHCRFSRRWIIFLLSTTYLVKITLQNEKIARYST